MIGRDTFPAMSWLRALCWFVLAFTMIIALSVTVSRLWPTHHAVTAVLTSFTVLALLPYGVGLLAIVVLGSGGWSWLWTLVTVATLGLIMLHLTWLAPSLTGQQSPVASDEHLRVLTINAQEGSGDAHQIVRAVDDLGVEILVVEEITPELVQRLAASGLATRLQHSLGEGRSRYAGTVVFSSFPLSDPRFIPTFFDSLRVTVQHPSGSLDLVAVHPVTPLRSPHAWDREHRLIREAAIGADIVTGDFNATLDHLPMRALRQDGFRSATELAGAGWSPTWPSNGRGSFTGRWVPRLIEIDHIMVRDGWAVSGVERVTIADTDHTGVCAQISRSG